MLEIPVLLSDSCASARICGYRTSPVGNPLGERLICCYLLSGIFLTVEERALSKQLKEVRASTLGSFEVYLDDKRLELKHEASRKVMAMLLLSDNNCCLRETVAETIWPNSSRSKALANLRQTVLTLKNTFKNVGGESNSLQADQKSISLVGRSVTLDTASIIDEIKSNKPLGNPAKIELDIAKGFLSELLPGSDLYADWIAEKEHTFFDELKFTLRSAIDSSGVVEVTLQYANLLSKLDSCDELACRARMEAFFCSGEQAKALRCYSDLWRELEEVHDIEPSSETQELAVAIKMNEDLIEKTAAGKKRSAPQIDNFVYEAKSNDTRASGDHLSCSPNHLDELKPQSIVPRIAVIPFVGRGVSEDQKIIGEVLADDLINVLSKCHTISVISRLSSSVFSGIAGANQAIDMLQVQYLMTGTYRLVSNKIVLDVEFSCAETSSILWTRRFSGKPDEFLQGEHQFVEGTLHGMGIRVMASELRKTSCTPLDRLEDSTLLIGAIALMHRLTMKSFKRSKDLFEVLIDRQPKHALPYVYLSMWYALRVVQGWSENPNRDGEIAYSLSSKALDLDPFLGLAHTLHGLVNTTLKKDLVLGEKSYTTALEYNRSDSLAWLFRGTLYAFQGNGEKAVADTNQAMSISPFDPHRYLYYSLAGTAAMIACRYDEAIDLTKKSLRLNPEHASTLRVLSVAQWKSGKCEDSMKSAKALLKLQPNFTVSSWLRVTPFIEPIAVDCGSALTNAGIPK